MSKPVPVLVLGVSKADCAGFARDHGITEFYWLSLNRDVGKLPDLRVRAVYATDLLRRDQVAFAALVDVAEKLRA